MGEPGEEIFDIYFHPPKVFLRRIPTILKFLNSQILKS